MFVIDNQYHKCELYFIIKKDRNCFNMVMSYICDSSQGTDAFD